MMETRSTEMGDDPKPVSIRISATPREVEAHCRRVRFIPRLPKRLVGRNALCPCGSGRKVKHCCLRRGGE